MKPEYEVMVFSNLAPSDNEETSIVGGYIPSLFKC